MRISLPLVPKLIARRYRAGVLAHVRKLLSIVDEAFAQRAAAVDGMGRKVACRSGCSACCYDYALVSAAEFAPIMDAFDALPEEDRRFVREQNARWMREHADQLSSAMVMEGDAELLSQGERIEMVSEVTRRSWERKTPCSFLKDHKCLIYNDRPMACRGHNLVDSRGPKVCEESLTSDSAPLRFEMSDVCGVIYDAIKKSTLPIFPMGELNVMLSRVFGDER
jgi:Fe-S-cluster containining protein